MKMETVVAALRRPRQETRMLFSLAQWLQVYPGTRLSARFQYITFRAVMAAMTRC